MSLKTSTKMWLKVLQHSHDVVRIPPQNLCKYYALKFVVEKNISIFNKINESIKVISYHISLHLYFRNLHTLVAQEQFLSGLMSPQKCSLHKRVAQSPKKIS